jgi:hypothetical protein
MPGVIAFGSPGLDTGGVDAGAGDWQERPNPMMNETISNKLIINIVLNAVNLVKLFFTLIPLYPIPAQSIRLARSRAIQASFGCFASLLPG